ncbi:MAG TPA: hypothetical protein VK217_02190 [Acidimicrobiales bacterium]|nr:hypothetical protein [Acidimicrobiales bacterium]
MATRWDYRVTTASMLSVLEGVTGRTDQQVTQANLKDLGSEGWELVALAPRSNAPDDPFWIFKRAIEW